MEAIWVLGCLDRSHFLVLPQVLPDTVSYNACMKGHPEPSLLLKRMRLAQAPGSYDPFRCP